MCVGRSVAGALSTASVDADGESGAALMCSYMQAVLSDLAALPLISVALVEGYAIGGVSIHTEPCVYDDASPCF